MAAAKKPKKHKHDASLSANDDAQLPYAVRCAHTKIAEIHTLVPHPRNPNRHPEGQIRMLAKIMAHQGFRNPIVVSARSGFIIKGHGRLAAAALNGWDSVPIDLQHYDNDADEWADMVADNRIAELAEPDREIIRELVLELGDDFDGELMGFDTKTMDALRGMQLPELDDGKEFDDDAADDIKWIECPHCKQKFPKS